MHIVKPILGETHNETTAWLPSINWNVKLEGAHLQTVKPDWYYPEQFHIGFEINLILQGCQETVMERNRYLIQTGDILLIPPGFKHISRCVSDGGMKYFTAHFNVDDPLFREEMIRHSRIQFPSGTEENRKLRQVLNGWIEMFKPDSTYTTMDRFRMQARLFELLSILAQFAGEGPREWEHPASPSAVQYAKAIAEAIKSRFNPYVSDELQQEQLKIEDIVSTLGISPGYGLEVFRQVYGMSPRRYLSELKLHEAKVLIQHSQWPLREVAAKLGYAHLSHFSRQFKRWTGMSPIQYRQRKLEQDRTEAGD